MVGWVFQYWNGSSWVNFVNAQIDHILEELSSVGGQEELVFDLLNTPANRSIVQAKPFVQALFGGVVIFPLASQNAIVAGFQYTPTTIEVTAYNYVFVQLSQASNTVTQIYTNTAVGTIAAYICGLAGVTVGSMPSLNVSIKFTNANCFKALQDLAKACGCEYWADGSGFNIGTRDSTIQSLGYVGSNSRRGLDYSKQVDQVIVNGVDASGVAIQGSAGSPGAIATFTEKKISDVATLNSLAAFKLQTLNNPSNGNSLECLISQVATWHPGQFVSASRSDLDLVGSFIIQRITKQAVSCTVEVDAAMPQMDILLQDTDQYGDLGVYQAAPSTDTPSALTLQGLLHLYHLTEGSGAVANDSTPNAPAVNGVITSGSWVAHQGVEFLTFSGSGYVDCPVTDTFTNKLAVGCWFSPSALVDQAEMIGLGNCYLLELSGTSGAIRFGLHIGGSWVYLTAPAGTIPVNGRCFALAVYDGANMYLYVANPNVPNALLTYSQVQTGNLDSPSGDLFLGGSSYQGVVNEVMVWGRSLSAQEVQELFFRPLTRIVAKGGGAVSGWKCAVDVNDPTTGTTSPAVGIQSVSSGASLTVTANPINNCLFGYWQFDGVDYPSWGNPVTVAAQADGSFHDLVAVFQGKGITVGRQAKQKLALLLEQWSAFVCKATRTLTLEQQSAFVCKPTRTINFKPPLIKDDLIAVGSWIAEGTGQVLSAVTSTPTPYNGLADCVKNTFTSVPANTLIGIKQTFGTPKNWSNMIDIHYFVYLSTNTSINNGVILKITDNTGKAVYDWCSAGNAVPINMWVGTDFYPYTYNGNNYFGNEPWDVTQNNFHLVPVGFDWTNISSVEIYVSFSAVTSGYIAFNYILSWSS